MPRAQIQKPHVVFPRLKRTRAQHDVPLNVSNHVLEGDEPEPSTDLQRTLGSQDMCATVQEPREESKPATLGPHRTRKKVHFKDGDIQGINEGSPCFKQETAILETVLAGVEPDNHCGLSPPIITQPNSNTSDSDAPVPYIPISTQTPEKAAISPRLPTIASSPSPTQTGRPSPLALTPRASTVVGITTATSTGTITPPRSPSPKMPSNTTSTFAVLRRIAGVLSGSSPHGNEKPQPPTFTKRNHPEGPTQASDKPKPTKTVSRVRAEPHLRVRSKDATPTVVGSLPVAVQHPERRQSVTHTRLDELCSGAHKGTTPCSVFESATGNILANNKVGLGSKPASSLKAPPKGHTRERSLEKQRVDRTVGADTIRQSRLRIPRHLHPGIPEYWQWLKDHGMLDEQGQIRSLEERRQFILERPAPQHPLTGNAFVVPDRYKPKEVVKGFTVSDASSRQHQSSTLGLDGTSDGAQHPEAQSVPASKARRQRVSFSLGGRVFSTGRDSQPASPVRPQASSSPARDSSPKPPQSLSASSQSRTNSTSSVSAYEARRRPIILQHGHAPTPQGPDDEQPKPYVRAWSAPRDPLGKLLVDDAIHRHHSRPRGPITLTPTPQLHELPAPSPPSTPLQPATPRNKPLKRVTSWSPTKTKKPSPSSSIITTTTTTPVRTTSNLTSLALPDTETDTQPIYITPPSGVPTLPQPGTLAYYKALQKTPLFCFDARGYVLRSQLTEAMTLLLDDPTTAPDWAGAIPSAPPRTTSASRSVHHHQHQQHHRHRKDAQQARAVDEAWALYRETLMVRADVRRGCGLARRAAADLRRDKEGAVWRGLRDADVEVRVRAALEVQGEGGFWAEVGGEEEGWRAW